MSSHREWPTKSYQILKWMKFEVSLLFQLCILQPKMTQRCEEVGRYKHTVFQQQVAQCFCTPLLLVFTNCQKLWRNDNCGRCWLPLWDCVRNKGEQEQDEKKHNLKSSAYKDARITKIIKDQSMLNSPKRAQGGFSPLQPSGLVSDFKCNISTAQSTRCKPRYARLYREYDFIFLGAQVKVHESNKSHRMGCRYAVITPFARLKGRIRLWRNF